MLTLQQTKHFLVFFIWLFNAIKIPCLSFIWGTVISDGNKFIMNCPAEGDWYMNEKKLNGDKTLSLEKEYGSDTKGLYSCKYTEEGTEKTYFFYIKGKRKLDISVYFFPNVTSVVLSEQTLTLYCCRCRLLTSVCQLLGARWTLPVNRHCCRRAGDSCFHDHHLQVHQEEKLRWTWQDATK